MAGTDTIRGIAYQQAQAIHCAIDLVENSPDCQLRVEGMDDVVDIEILDSEGNLVGARQVKTRRSSLWNPGPIRHVMRRWASLDEPEAAFIFLTDGQLGPGARALQEALDDNSPKRELRIAKKMNITAAAAKCLERATIRVDPSSVGTLLKLAETRLARLMDPLERDVSVVAGQRVDHLFTILTQRAANNDPNERVLSSEELRELVGGTYGYRAESDWNLTVRNEFVAATATRDMKIVPLVLQSLSNPTESGLDTDLLLGSGVSALSGATGTGKSSAINSMQLAGAASGRAVVVCRAESYSPSYLNVLVSDAIGAAIGRPVPEHVGRQALADASSIVVIDGVSEIPSAVANCLAMDLRPVLLRQGLASLVVVGRDPAILRRVLSLHGSPKELVVAPLSRSAQFEILRNLTSEPISDTRSEALLGRAVRALGVGVQNPMLLTLYSKVASESSDTWSRVDVYWAVMTQLFERASSVDAKGCIPVLGFVFARLLEKEKRYSDRYEWIRITDEAARLQGAPMTGEDLREVALKIGLVKELSVTGVTIPFHDSIADFLAAAALASGLVELPDSLGEAQSEWVLFAGEMGCDLPLTVTSQLPFLAVRLADASFRSGELEEFRSRAGSYLRVLLSSPVEVISALETPDGRSIIEIGEASDRKAVRFVSGTEDGALSVAVRAWRLVLRDRLLGVESSVAEKPTNVEEASALVQKFVRTREKELLKLLAGFPPQQRSQLLNRLRPLGLTFTVGQIEDFGFRHDWPLNYTRSPEIRVLQAHHDPASGKTGVMSFLEKGAARSAALMLVDAIEQLVDRRGWLA